MGRDKVPILGEETIYSDWKKRVRWWNDVTDVKDEKRAATLIMHMSGKPESMAIQLDRTALSVAGSVEKLLTEMDKFYKKDETAIVFSAIDNFLTYRKPPDATMGEYLREFNQRYKLLQESREKSDTPLFEDGILAYFLLHQAGLNQEQMRLIKATVETLSYANMEKALKRTYGENPLSSSSGTSCNPTGGYTVSVKEEPTFYQRYPEQDQDHMFYDHSQFQRQRPEGKFRGSRNPQNLMQRPAPIQHDNPYANSKRKDYKCFKCGEQGHYSRHCRSDEVY